ncbi:MAG: hypothetical protein HC790_11995 [Acaryochloridaceae cyanobacterium CSU_3_4]|nr:hypothetical protein [Acaryochloridaceae cyanobacterium CSU_3_4]
MAKTFNRVAEIVKSPASTSAVTSQRHQVSKQQSLGSVINLERFNLNDRGNWIRAIDSSHPDATASLDELLEQIAEYQGQIERTMQSAEAQSTIYAYAIGSRLDVIEAERLFEVRGYKNLTDFIKGGEIKRPGGASITTRQIWAYRKVTRGLNEFLALAEQLRDGGEPPEPIREKLSAISAQVDADVTAQFREGYVEGIARVLELGVSKLEQVYRLPESVAYSGLIAGGQLQIDQEIIPIHDVSFSELRSAVSQETAKKSAPVSKISMSTTIRGLEKVK